MPLHYIAKNPNFAHFPPFSATFNTLLVYLHHREKENVSTGFVLAYFCRLLVFSVLFSLYNVRYILNEAVFAPILAK